MRLTGLLQPLSVQNKMRTDISMDIIEGLSYCNGYTIIMIVVDRLPKYVQLVSLKHPFTAVTIIKGFVNNVVGLHSIPTLMVSD